MLDCPGQGQPHATNLDGQHSNGQFQKKDPKIALKEGRVASPVAKLVLLTAACAPLSWIRWRFSLRTLLFATTLVAVVLGLVVWAAR
jgi:hypothetical protein